MNKNFVVMMELKYEELVNINSINTVTLLVKLPTFPRVLTPRITAKTIIVHAKNRHMTK